MRLRILALGALFLSQFSLASADVSSAMPQLDQAKASWSYRILGFAFRGIEETLIDSGFQFQVCTYTSHLSGKVVTQKGMGECLFENFRDGLRAKGNVGITHLWMSTRTGETLPVKVEWRPSEEGLFKMARELVSLKLEDISHWWSEHFGNDPAEQKELPYSQNILGRLRLTFPAGTTLLDFISEEKQGAVLGHLPLGQAMEFQLTPLYKSNGYAHYQGVLSVEQAVAGKDPSGVWTLDFTTNMNFLKTSRPFKVKGHYNSGFQEELP